MTSSPTPARLYAALLIVAPFSAIVQGCATPQLSLTPRLAVKSLDGDFLAMDPTAVMPSAVSSDLESMGLDDSELSLGLRADLKFGSPHVILYGSQSSFSGDGSVTGTIQFGGVTLAGGERVDTDFDLGQYTGLILFDVLPTKSVDLGIGFGLTLLDFDLQIESLTTPGNMVSTDEIFPIPVLAANVAVDIGQVDISLLVSGLSVSVSDAEGTLLDADAAVRWKFIGGKNHFRGSVLLGWRQTDLDFEYDDGDDNVEADIGLSGPYLALQLTL